ncbi:gluconokinase [Evansella vedderi]|uniref:Gluconokinase n=1 Tax=Evansella vedderi TaxID=38282 RepID=A0ABU0A167_9BACI|nr:gluconokinase [Evansella vedderi]MDQ0256721.1 gluconokinase [Evansella vedderi]
MLRELVIGLDLGTTSVKAVLFDSKGKLLAEVEELITSYYPKLNWVEQDPEEIEHSARVALKRVLETGKVQHGELLSVGFSSAMHSLICLDENGNPLSKMFIWADGRSSEQAEKLAKTNGKDIYMRTGTPIHPMTPFMKLLWMKETGFEPYEKASYFMSMKEFLIDKWFGKRVIDYSMASATGLFNLTTYDWDAEVLNMAGITREQLAVIVPPTEVISPLKPSISDEIGIPSDVPFVLGAADGQLANLGSGAISPGEVAISVGTSGAIRQFITGSQINETQETFSYAFTDNTSIIGGPTNNGGITIQWLKEMMEFKGSHDEFLAGAEKVEVGAEGVVFHPYINGERAPLWNQHAKGNFFGLSVAHKKEHLVRAVLEGITYNIYQIGKSLEKLAGEPKKIFVNGGLARSSLWVQILADVFGKEIYLTDTHHSAAWGAAWTALVGVGKKQSFEEIRDSIHIESIVKPNMENHEKYMTLYIKYENIGKDIEKYFT